jgi:hypothetical protein
MAILAENEAIANKNLLALSNSRSNQRELFSFGIAAVQCKRLLMPVNNGFEKEWRPDACPSVNMRKTAYMRSWLEPPYNMLRSRPKITFTSPYC